MKRPIGSCRPPSTATKMRRSPWAKQLCSRGRDRLVAVRRAICRSGKASNPLHGSVASASPPTLTTHKVATAIANHKRLARAGSVILVWCHCHPPRLVSLKPPSIQVRILYHTTLAASGARVRQHQPRIGIDAHPSAPAVYSAPCSATSAIHHAAPSASRRRHQLGEPIKFLRSHRTHLAAQIDAQKRMPAQRDDVTEEEGAHTTHDLPAQSPSSAWAHCLAAW